jgi:hypothetical protein
MPQSFTTQSGVTLKIPGTYVDQQVRANQGGIAAAGVVTLIGEANEGPDYTKESDLDTNAFAPDDIAGVLTKYGSGRLVDAFRSIVAAANDPNIVGAVSLVKLVKVNPSTKAEADVVRAGFGDYGLISARREGRPGNLIKYRSEISVAEAPPTTGKFAYCPHYAASPVTFSLRQNGSAADAISIASLVSGPSFASAVEDLSVGTLAAGGAEKLPLTGKAGNISLAVIDAGTNTIQVSIPGLIDADQLPAVGDSLVIPKSGDFSASSDSAVLGASDANRASYVITAVSNSSGTSTITARRINTPPGAPAAAAVSSTPIATVRDLICYTQVEIENITGMDRQSTVELAGVTFNTTANASGQFTMTLTDDWSAQPSIGDYVKFAGTFAGVTAGWYQVVSATSSGFICQRLSNGSSGTTGSTLVVGPVAQGTQPFFVYKQTIDGLGKSMEIIGTPSSIARNPQTTAAASWTSGEPLLVSASEYENSTTISRGNQSDTFLSGGDILASFGCSQEDAVIIVGANDVDFQVNSVSQFKLAYKDYPTLKDIVDYADSQSTFHADVSTAQFELVPSSSLDRGTFKLSASKSSNRPGRLKRDATQWASNASGGVLAEASLASGTQSGLPEAISPDQFLSGGSKAGSTSAQWAGAVEACEAVETNFLVPLISKDASEDLLEGETESSSTYSVDSVNAALKSHVIKMSALKARKNRLAIVSRSGAYSAQKAASSALASFRVSMAFQDVKVLGGDGTIQQFQPWMGAVIAAGMQSAAGYKGIVKKFANISGLAKPEADFDPRKPGDLEDALSAGLLIMEPVRSGGFRWVSDQTTYSVDNNFVFNSLQAVYIADIMTLTLIQNFDRAVVGKSVAEVSAAAALAFLEGELFNFLRLRFTAPSDDAPKGFKNASVKLVGGAMQVSLEAKLAGIIYFVPIQFEISQVEQTANQQ